MLHRPVTAASVKPVRRWSLKRRRRYGTRLEKERGSRDTRLRLNSRKVPGSARESMRSRAVMLWWKRQRGQTR